MHHLSLAVITSDNTPWGTVAEGGEVSRCLPGDAVELVPLPCPDVGKLFVQVVTESGIPIGQLTTERSDWIRRVMSEHRVRAVYQQSAIYGAVIRVAFNGENPAVPAALQ